jgi:hypothetical protein
MSADKQAASAVTDRRYSLKQSPAALSILDMAAIQGRYKASAAGLADCDHVAL